MVKISDKTPKKYQDKAINKLISRTKELFEENLDKRTIVFQAPTGSGKTFMISDYVQQIISEFDDKNLCFLWVSIGKGDLQTQSYDSLKKEFQGFPDCFLLEQEFFGSRKSIEKNEVVVVNWEKLRTKDKKTGDWKNILMKDKETVNFRELIKNTKEEGKTIVMIIDESHSSSTSERALALRNEINADLTIEMSATPVLKEGYYNEKIVVDPIEVINEGMIKKEILINENIDKIDSDEKTSQELIMEVAYKKRLEIKKLYDELGLKINPLVLIQLPNKEAGEDKKKFIEDFLSQKKINYGNKKLVLWLSEEKINYEKEFVTPNESDVEFLIFKQAIDTGWDCPRAQILVRFREIKSMVFEIQTVGRILRMPEAKHYLNDNLNRAFVYTNVQSLEIKKETYNPNIIKSVLVKRKDVYKPLKLRSYYRNRLDYGDITSRYYEVLEHVLCEYFNVTKNKFGFNVCNQNKEKLKKKIDTKNLDNKDEIILNKELNAKELELITDEEIKGDETLRVNLSQNDLFHLFENLIATNLNGFAPKRSIPTVKQALYNWFRKYLGMKLTGKGIIYIQSLCLNNIEIFSRLIGESIIIYKPIKREEHQKKIEALEEWNDEWEISESRNYNPHVYKKYNYKLNLYDPCYLNLDSKLEKNFIEFLEKNESNIKWWWQNGNEHMALNFGIKYGGGSTFQPDFIVLLKDGRMGIFDTKGVGLREDENKLKGEALQKYISEENKKGEKLFGGLVVENRHSFMINDREIYRSFKNNPEDWECLEF